MFIKPIETVDVKGQIAAASSVDSALNCSICGEKLRLVGRDANEGDLVFACRRRGCDCRIVVQNWRNNKE